MLSYIDPKGRKWHPFTLTWRNEIDGQSFSVNIWAIDWAHAEDQIEHIKQNGKITGQLIETVKGGE